MDQWRPAKPKEIKHILTELSPNILPKEIKETKIKQLKGIKVKSIKFGNENQSLNSLNLIQKSFELKLKEAKAQTKKEEEKNKRLKKSHKYEIEGISEEVKLLLTQKSSFDVRLNIYLK